MLLSYTLFLFTPKRVVAPLTNTSYHLFLNARCTQHISHKNVQYFKTIIIIFFTLKNEHREVNETIEIYCGLC